MPTRRPCRSMSIRASRAASVTRLYPRLPATDVRTLCAQGSSGRSRTGRCLVCVSLPVGQISRRILIPFAKSILRRKNFPLSPSGKSPLGLLPSRARSRGVSRSSRHVGRGMRWMRLVAGVNISRWTKHHPQTAKSCGPAKSSPFCRYRDSKSPLFSIACRVSAEKRRAQLFGLGS